MRGGQGGGAICVEGQSAGVEAFGVPMMPLRKRRGRRTPLYRTLGEESPLGVTAVITPLLATVEGGRGISTWNGKARCPYSVWVGSSLCVEVQGRGHRH